MAQKTWIATIYMDPKNRRQPRQVTVEAPTMIEARLDIRKQYGTGLDGWPRAIEYQHSPVEKR